MVSSFLTKSGDSALIRYPTLEDTKLATEYINTISQEDTYITFSGEQPKEQEESKYITKSLAKIESGDMVELYCFVGRKLVAEGYVERDLRTRKRGKHRAMLGITVKKEYRGQGIGKDLLKALIAEAKNKKPEVRIIILTVLVLTQTQLIFTNH